MNTKIAAAALVLAIASLVISLTKRPGPAESLIHQEGEVPKPSSLVKRSGDSEIEARIAALESRLEPSLDEGDPESSISDRLSAIESSLEKLTESFAGISLESASEDRDALFRSEGGYLKADEYFAAGKFAIAGEGYLAFLEAHPDHPEAYDILKRARDSFAKAGYDDKAVWAQQELLRNLGEDRRSEDVLALAQLHKDAGDFDNAVKHAAEAAELSTDINDRLWNRMYWAWYNQLRDGEQAGIDAYREVQTEIDAAGRGDGKLGDKVREKIGEIERSRRSVRRSASS